MTRFSDPIVPGDMVRYASVPSRSHQSGLGFVLGVDSTMQHQSRLGPDNTDLISRSRCALVMWLTRPGVRTEELAMDWYPLEFLIIHIPAGNAGDRVLLKAVTRR